MTEPVEAAAPAPLFSLDRILPVTVNVRAELGRTRMPIKELLAVTQGTVIGFEELAGEPLSIYANNVLIAKGEVVVIGDKFGIRVTDVIANDKPCLPSA